MSYNGWANRNTWLLNVDGFFYNAFEGCTFDSVDDLADAMENMFHDFIDEHLPENLLIRDFVNTSGIDFQTLAEHYADDHEGVIRKDEDETDEDEDEETDEDEE